MKPRPLRCTSQLTAAILAMLAHQATAQSVMTWDGSGIDANWLNNGKTTSKQDTVDVASSTAGILSAVDLSLQLSSTLVADPSKSIRLQANHKGGSGGGSTAGTSGSANLSGGGSAPFEGVPACAAGRTFLTTAAALSSSDPVAGSNETSRQFTGTNTPDSDNHATSLLSTSSPATPLLSLGISGSTAESLQASSLAIDGSLIAPVSSPPNPITIGFDPQPVGQSNANTTYTWENSNVAASPTAILNLFGSTQGTWTNGTPVSDNTNTIKFFQDTSTPLANTTENGTQNVVMDSGSAFHLATLTLSGYGSATPGKHFEMTISSAVPASDTLNFSAAAGTVNLDALNNTAANITYQINSNIQLGTASSGTVLTFQGAGSGTFNINSSITELQVGGGSIIKTGASTVYLKVSNNYTGNTAVQQGILKIGHFGALGGAAVGTTVTGGASLQLVDVNLGSEPITINGNGVSTGGALRNVSGSTYGGLLTLGSAARVNSDTGQFILSGGITGSGHTLTVGGGGNTSITAAIATGTGGLIKDGTTGTLTLNQANTYTGLTEVKEGVVNIRHAQGLGGTNGEGGTIVASGAALQLQGGITTPAEPLTLGGTGQSLTGALRNMSGENTYAGRLTLSAATRINSDSGLLTISNASSITGNTFGLTVGGAGNTTIASPIQTTSGTLTKDGIGTLILSGTSNYSGTTKILGGILSVATIGNHTVAGNLGQPNSTAGSRLVFEGGTLRYTGVSASTNRNFQITDTYEAIIDVLNSSTNLTITGASSYDTAGSLKKVGLGTLTLAGTNTHTGATTISEGSLRLGNGGTTGSFAVDSQIVNNATLVLNRSDTLTQGLEFNSVISGTGTVIHTGGTGGTGITILNGENTYQGGTTVDAGTLSVNNTVGSGTGTGSVLIASGATLMGTGHMAGDVTVNGTHAPGNSPGIESTGGNLSYGATSVFEWELTANTTSQAGGPFFDQMLMTDNTKVLTIVSGATINLHFDLAGGTVDFSDTAFWNQTQSWPVIAGYASYSGEFTIGTISLDNFGNDSIDYPIGYPPGQFTMTGGTLTWTAVPEPTSALAGLMVTAGLLRRRRTQVSH